MQPSTARLRFESGGPARRRREFRSRAAEPVGGGSRLAGTLAVGGRRKEDRASGVKATIPAPEAARADEEEHDAMKMDEINIHDYARQLLDAHGAQAVVEAARKARDCAQQGENEQAETWRRVQAALKEMRGPHVS
jgi:hypothetical protein